MEMGFREMKMLTELIKPKEDSESDEDDLKQTGLRKMGPGHVGPSRKDEGAGGDSAGCSQNDEDAIWTEAEVPNSILPDMNSDPRERPEYDIKYSQDVSPEDIYLQMGGRTPGTASCEYMIVSVSLPEEDRNNIDFNVTKDTLQIRSPRYYLSLGLPHHVDPEKCKVEWDRPLLKIKLRLQREYDFVNF